MALTLGTSVEYLTGKSKDDTPTEIVINCDDPRLSFLVEKYQSVSEAQKERIYNYAKKLGFK